MIDRTIPFFNMILRCDVCKTQAVHLPSGFSIVPYQPGYETAWAKLEYALRDFDSAEEAEHYFISFYLQDTSHFDDILFLVNPEKAVVGSCIAWTDLRNEQPVASLHWLVVAEEVQGLGLGKALCIAAMNRFRTPPVYIHTQPWSYKAIFLYLSLGFRLQRHDTFSHYNNQYDEAMSTLKAIVTKEQFELLQELSDG